MPDTDVDEFKPCPACPGDCEEAVDCDPFEVDPDNNSTVRAKWSMDGAETLSEAAQMLRNVAEDLERLERDGWQLTGPVRDDYGHIRRAPRAEAGR